MSHRCTCINTTSGKHAGTKQIGFPLNGSFTTFAELFLNVSVPRSTLVEIKGKPIATAKNLH